MSHTYLYSPAAEHYRTLAGTDFHPAEGRRLSWPGWLGEILRWFAHPKTVIHPSTSCGGRESNSGQSSRKSSALTTEPPYNVSPCDLAPRRPVLCFWSSVTVRCCALSRPRWVSQQDEPETILSSGRLEGRATGTVISLDGLANGRNELVDDELDSSVVDVCSDSPPCHVGNKQFQRSELKPNSIMLAGSELAPKMFGASLELVRS